MNRAMPILLKRSLMVLSAVGLATVCLAADHTDWPYAEAWTVSDVPASVYTHPDGNGHPLAHCQAFGGDLGHDATIIMRVVTMGGDPIENWPFEDLWIEPNQGGMFACIAGNCADANTDANGETSFATPLAAGGYSNYPDDLMVAYMSGLPAETPPMAVYVNSPDLDGNLVVNLTDLVLFAMAYRNGEMAYRYDYWWDGVLDISDVVLFTQGYGTECP